MNTGGSRPRKKIYSQPERARRRPCEQVVAKSFRAREHRTAVVPATRLNCAHEKITENQLRRQSGKSAERFRERAVARRIAGRRVGEDCRLRHRALRRRTPGPPVQDFHDVRGEPAPVVELNRARPAGGGSSSSSIFSGLAGARGSYHLCTLDLSSHQPPQDSQHSKVTQRPKLSNAGPYRRKPRSGNGEANPRCLQRFQKKSSRSARSEDENGRRKVFRPEDFCLLTPRA